MLKSTLMPSPQPSKIYSAEITYIPYKGESQVPDIMSLIENDLSEPYSVYTYRYFLCQWPHLCFLARDEQRNRTVGVILCKMDLHAAGNSRSRHISRPIKPVGGRSLHTSKAAPATPQPFPATRLPTPDVSLSVSGTSLSGADEFMAPSKDRRLSMIREALSLSSSRTTEPVPTTTQRGYIAMLSVHSSYRKLGIGSALVNKAISTLEAAGADEVVLETEVTNLGALRLYHQLGFVRDKRLARYYLNGVDAFRLKLWLR